MQRDWELARASGWSVIEGGKSIGSGGAVDGQEGPGGVDPFVDNWLYSRVFFSLPDAVLLVCEADGTVVDANQGALDLLGKSSVELIGAPARAVLGLLAARFKVDGLAGCWCASIVDGQAGVVLQDLESLLLQLEEHLPLSHNLVKGRGGNFILVRLGKLGSGFNPGSGLVSPSDGRGMKSHSPQFNSAMSVLGTLCELAPLDAKYLAVYCISLEGVDKYRRGFGTELFTSLAAVARERILDLVPVGAGLFDIDDSQVALISPEPCDVEGLAASIVGLFEAPVQIGGFVFKLSVSVGCYFSSLGEVVSAETSLNRAIESKDRAVLEGGNRYALYCDGDWFLSSVNEISSRYAFREALSAERVPLILSAFLTFPDCGIAGCNVELPGGRFAELYHSTVGGAASLDSLELELFEWVLTKSLASLSFWLEQGVELSVNVKLHLDLLAIPGFIERMRNLISRFDARALEYLRVGLDGPAPDTEADALVPALSALSGIGFCLGANGFDSEILSFLRKAEVRPHQLVFEFAADDGLEDFIQNCLVLNAIRNNPLNAGAEMVGVNVNCPGTLALCWLSGFDRVQGDIVDGAGLGVDEFRGFLDRWNPEEFRERYLVSQFDWLAADALKNEIGRLLCFSSHGMARDEWFEEVRLLAQRAVLFLLNSGGPGLESARFRAFLGKYNDAVCQQDVSQGCAGYEAVAEGVALALIDVLDQGELSVSRDGAWES